MNVPCLSYNIQIKMKSIKKVVKGTREYPRHVEGEDGKTDTCPVELGQWVQHPTASGLLVLLSVMFQEGVAVSQWLLQVAVRTNTGEKR